MEEKAKDPKDEQGKDADIVHAFYVVYNRKENKWGVIGSPGFFDDRSRVDSCLAEVVRQIDSYYEQQKKLHNRIVTGVQNFNNKMNFRNFMRKPN